VISISTFYPYAVGTNTNSDFEFWRGIPVFNFDYFGKNYFVFKIDIDKIKSLK